MDNGETPDFLWADREPEAEPVPEQQEKFKLIYDYHMQLMAAAGRAVTIFEKAGESSEASYIRKLFDLGGYRHQVSAVSSNLIPLGEVDAQEGQTHGFATVSVEYLNWASFKKRAFHKPTVTRGTMRNGLIINFFAGTESAVDLSLLGKQTLPRDYREVENTKPPISFDEVLARMECSASRRINWEDFEANQRNLLLFEGALEFIEKRLDFPQQLAG